jgi:ribosomal protein L11 methyltransferase
MKPAPPSWQIFSLRPGLALEEILTAFLLARGAVGTHQIEDRLLAYFPEPCAIEKIKNDLNDFFVQWRAGGMNWPAVTITNERIVAQDWHSAWKRYFKPFLISERILIRPSWEVAALAPGQIEIVIDPKQAFGTGHHATTAGMLQLLEKYLRPGMRVIDVDVGAGTGILAIAAAKLQPEVRAVALDTDPIAVEAAQENIHLNRVQNFIKLYAGPLAALHAPPVDLILANLQHQTLMELLPDFAKILKRDGMLLMSGILEHEGESIKSASQRTGLECLEIRKEEEWLTMALAASLQARA